MNKWNANEPTHPPMIYQAEFGTPWYTKILFFLFSLVIVGAGILLLEIGNYIIASILLVIGSFFVYSTLVDMNDSSPEIKINKNGVWLKPGVHIPWETIGRADIKISKGYKTKTEVLQFFSKQDPSDLIGNVHLSGILNKNELFRLLGKYCTNFKR